MHPSIIEQEVTLLEILSRPIEKILSELEIKKVDKACYCYGSYGRQWTQQCWPDCHSYHLYPFYLDFYLYRNHHHRQVMIITPSTVESNIRITYSCQIDRHRANPKCLADVGYEDLLLVSPDCFSVLEDRIGLFFQNGFTCHERIYE